jgi:flagellar biosynthesis protein FlhG
MTDLVSPFIQKTLQRSDGQNIVILTSGGGENGKTWVSVAMAGILADMGQKVLLFDGDLGLANIDVQLGIATYQDITAVLTAKVPMNKAVIHYELGGFDVITGRSSTHSLQALDASSIQLMKDDLMLLATHYDTVIVDLGSSSDIMTRLFCDGVGRMLLFCSDELTSLSEARTLLKVLSNKGYIEKIGIVINAVPSLKEGNRTYYTLVKACDDFMKNSPPLIGVIRQDLSVVQALDNRLSVFNAYPDSIAIKDVKNLIKTLKKE